MKLRILIIFILFLAIIAQPARPQQTAKPLGKEQVTDLVKAGMETPELVKLIREHGVDFDLTDDYLQTLRNAGAQEPVIQALRAVRPKLLSKEQVLQLVAGHVPSERAAALVQQHGIDFQADEQYFDTLRLAGGDDTLIAALREASAAVTGEMVVTTSPNAEVYLDGELLGKADAQGELTIKSKLGPHALKVTLSGRKDFELNVTLALVKGTKITARLEDLAGTVVIQTSPGAAVFIDDSSRGKTDAKGQLAIPEVAAGSHELRVSASGKKEYRQTVKVVAGQESAIEATLEDIEWYLGTWTSSWSNASGLHLDQGKIVFSKSDSGQIESEGFQSDGNYGRNVFRGTLVNPGEIRWEVYLDPRLGCCPSGWQPVISSEISSDKRTMKILVPSQWATETDSRRGSRQKPNTYVLIKTSDSQSH
jgi:hypothetical protein